MNYLELKKDEHPGFITVIKCNGAEVWERHQAHYNDGKVLENIKNRNYYQHTKGDWLITLPIDQRVFRDTKFITAIDMAIEYTHQRDNPAWENYF